MNKDTEKLPDKASSITVKADGTHEFDSGSYALKLIEYQQKQMEHLAKLNAYGEYIDGEYSVSEAKVKLEESKRNLKNGLKESYSTLLDLENKIDMLKEQVNSTNTKLSFGKAQVDMGLMLQNDYDKQVIESEDLDTGIRKLVYTYNNLKESIEKPWILSNK
jgi:phage shock protein A